MTDLLHKRIYNASIGNINWFRKYDLKFLNSNKFNRLHTNTQIDNDQTLDTTNNYYIYGDPNTGKTTSINYLYPNHYNKQYGLIWDKFYNLNPNHATVNIELNSIDSFVNTIDTDIIFKKMSSVDPFRVKTNLKKSIKIRPTTIIITSQLSPVELFDTQYDYILSKSQIENCLNICIESYHIMHINDWLHINNITKM